MQYVRGAEAARIMAEGLSEATAERRASLRRLAKALLEAETEEAQRAAFEAERERFAAVLARIQAATEMRIRAAAVSLH